MVLTWEAEAKDPRTKAYLSGEKGVEAQRAARLLIEHLTPRQRKRYLRMGNFIVRGSRRGRYLLTNWGGQSKKLVGFLPFWPLWELAIWPCVHVSGLKWARRRLWDIWDGDLRRQEVGPLDLYCDTMPRGDELLAFKLLIETDERAFRLRANWRYWVPAL